MRALLQNDWRGRALSGPAPRIELSTQGDRVAVAVESPLWGDPPPAAPSGRLWELWNYEVVEVFIAGPAESYLELELGPHGHHLFLRLEGIRQISDDALPLLDYCVTRDGDRWRGDAAFERSLLPPGPHRINVCAIHGTAPRVYRSLVPLPGDAPNFHQPAAFLPWRGGGDHPAGSRAQSPFSS